MTAPAKVMRPTAADLAAARGRTIPDVVGPGLRVLFSGINPSLYSAATGCHFARPGNRFWPTLHASGFTATQLSPSEQWSLLSYGLGITNLVARATVRADELSPAELRAGGESLALVAERLEVPFVAVLGVTAYRAAFAVPGAVVGPQAAPLGGAHVWVLPNTSGLNASWQLPRLAAAFRDLREAADVAAAAGARVRSPGTPCSSAGPPARSS